VPKQLLSIVPAEFMSVEYQEYLSFHLCFRNLRMALINGDAHYLFGGHRAAHAQTLLAGFAHHHVSKPNSNIRVCVEYRLPLCICAPNPVMNQQE